MSLRGTHNSVSSSSNPPRDYDLVVIGGGSGGMAAAKEAAKLGARVALFDYVKPSTQGSRWGLGGTCVNVGCVPKKICHYAGLLGEAMRDAHELGWKVEKETAHDWTGLTDKVLMQRGQLNWSYKQGLRSNKVNYINALASFSSPHHIKYVEKGQEKELTADAVLIAVGGRPSVPLDVPGAAECAVTSDDIFTLEKSPGKTLCVGGSYIALECAGFLTSLGLPVSVAYRSILLRGFDRQCAEKIGVIMEELGTRFLPTTMPTRIVKREDGRLDVSLINTSSGHETVETYDTVFFATGRTPDTRGLNLEAAGVKALATGKLRVDGEERTNVKHIFAVGDVLEGRQELTPVAIKTGELLARRLFGRSIELMDYGLVPTTVFTPTEYGCVGLSEEDAIAKHGEEDVEVFLSEYMTLEIAATHRTKHPRLADEALATGLPPDLSPMCLAKLVCVKSQDNKVVGLHYVGPNAGEVTQGFALGLRLGAKKSDFDSLVGIHPTDAEAFTQLTVTKRSGESWLNVGCGGGKCG